MDLERPTTGDPVPDREAETVAHAIARFEPGRLRFGGKTLLYGVHCSAERVCQVRKTYSDHLAFSS
jgi:hypothetical protein